MLRNENIKESLQFLLNVANQCVACSQVIVQILGRKSNVLIFLQLWWSLVVDSGQHCHRRILFPNRMSFTLQYPPNACPHLFLLHNYKVKGTEKYQNHLMSSMSALYIWLYGHCLYVSFLSLDISHLVIHCKLLNKIRKLNFWTDFSVSRFSSCKKKLNRLTAPTL